jgi:hypothetical protein
MTEAVDQNKTKVTFAYNASLPPSYKNNDAILDSCTTGNYLTVDSPVTNLKLTPNGIQAKALTEQSSGQPTNASYASQTYHQKPE